MRLENRIPRSNSQGFTLIELLIVVAIIGILAAIAIPNFLQAQTRAKISRAMAEMKSIATALELYSTDNNDYINGALRSDSPGYENPVLGVNRFSLLTSPVEYMATLPELCPFSPWYSVWIGEIDGYLYWGGAQYRETVMRALPSWILPLSWEKSVFYLMSGGPSRQYSGGVAGKIVVYDPTNGTISLGEICYVKGRTDEHSFH